jgi:hypothetical protein
MDEQLIILQARIEMLERELADQAVAAVESRLAVRCRHCNRRVHTDFSGIVRAWDWTTYCGIGDQRHQVAP